MKKINKVLIIVFLVLGHISQAQDREQKFAAYTITDPFAYNDGFNIGVGIEYQMNYMYFGAQAFTFPDLNGITYSHFIGTIGFNIHSYNGTLRGYAGLNGGTIIRNGNHALVGGEAGIDFKIPRTNLYIGTGATYHLRGDSKIWGNETAYWRFNGFIKIGVKW